MQSAAENNTETSKRRSMRIVQAVPLVITGVDALGRPFQERSSTLAINCHGGRYQSKHYVLKNMWVTLEVPHPQSGVAPRRVRGRVTWIQRPRTVRELFQVAVELENPGNIWGIAFPPPDWFPFDESARSDSDVEAIPLEAVPEISEEETPAPAETLDNLRVLPLPGADASLTLARQVARLMVEAKQQIQAAVREATARAVEAETRPLLGAVESQLRESARRAVQEATATQAEQLAKSALERAGQASQELLQSLRDAWNHESEQRIDAAAHEFLARLGKLEQARGSAFEQQLENSLRENDAQLQRRDAELSASRERVEGLFSKLDQELDRNIASARQRIESLLEAKAHEVFSRLAELEQAAQRATDDFVGAASAVQQASRARMEADRAAAAASWQDTLEHSIEDAARRTAERLSQQTESAASLLEGELALRLSAQRQSFDDVATQAQTALGTLREALDLETPRTQELLASMEESRQRVESQAASLEEMSRATASELQRRFEGILTEESAKLTRRAEAAVAGMAERLQPAIEAAGQETLARLAGQLEAQLASQVDRAKHLTEKLAARTGSAARLLQEHEQHLRETSEKTTQDATARLHEILGRFERDFDEAGRTATARWMGEIESKATETTHTTFEALLKAAAWYEKKVQSQMQATLEKGTEQAEAQLRQKAGEISGLFAAELDHYHRSYVEHAQEQAKESLAGLLQKAREEMGANASAVAASLEGDAREVAQKKYEQFSTGLDEAVEKVRGRGDAITADGMIRMETEAVHFLGDFRKRMDEQLAEGLAKTRQSVDAELAPLEKTWRERRAAREQEFGAEVARLANDSIENYKQRLENASNSFLVATIAGLGQQSQSVIDHMTQVAEARLRDVTSQVFSGIGETLRQRLLDLSASFSPPAPPPGKKEG